MPSPEPASSSADLSTERASCSTEPVALAGASSETVQSGKAKPKRVAFDSSACPTGRREGQTSARPSRPRHRMIYGIKLSEAGMRSWHAAPQSVSPHLDPPPAHLKGDALEDWWMTREYLLGIVIPLCCKTMFDIPKVDDAHITFVRDEGDEVCVVPLADTGAREKRYRALPSEAVAEGVAKFMHQEGDVPRWYRLARM